MAQSNDSQQVRNFLADLIALFLVR